MNGARKPDSKKPRVKLNYDDNRKGSVFIKPFRRDSKGRLIEGNLPRNHEPDSESETSPSEANMGKRRRSRRDRDHPEERKRKKERHRDHRSRNEPQDRNRVDRYFTRAPETQHQGPSHRDDRRAPQKSFKSYRRPPEPEEEAPPDRHDDAPKESGENVHNTKTSRQTVSCPTSITPGRFVESGRTADANHLPGHINVTLNVCGVPAAPTIVKETSGITIQCNHPRSNTAHANARNVPSDASMSKGKQSSARDSPPVCANDPAASEECVAARNQDPGVRKVLSQKQANVKNSSHEATPAGTSRRSPDAKPLKLTPILSPRSIRLEERELFREENIWARLNALKRNLSHSQSAPPTPAVERKGSSTISTAKEMLTESTPEEPPAIATPEGPARRPFCIVSALPPSTRRIITASSLKSVPVSESVRQVLLHAFLRDCAFSHNFRNFRESHPKIQTGHQSEGVPTEATVAKSSILRGRHCNVVSRPNGGSPEGVGDSEKVYSVDDVRSLVQELLSSRPMSQVNSTEYIDREKIAHSGGSSIHPEPSHSRQPSPKRFDAETQGPCDEVRPDFVTPPSRRRVVVEEAPKSGIETPQTSNYRKSSPRIVHAERRSCDEEPSGFRTPPARRSVITEEMPSEIESLHIPIVITERDKVFKRQSVEVQVRDRDINRERVSSAFELVDRGPPIPEIGLKYASNTRMNRFETITIDDVRGAKLIGQFDRSFLVLSKDAQGKNLLLIDQHALHERILLEQFEDECYRNTDQPTPTCILAPAVIIRVREVAQMQLVERDISMMERHGFLVKAVHNEVITIQTAPRCLSTKDVERVRNITAVLFQEFIGGSETFSSIFHRLLKSRACHSAIKCPQELDEATQERLIQQMLKCRLPFQCCHGRPSIHPIRSNILEVSIDGQIDQSALWQRIKLNADREKMDRQEGTPPDTP